LAIFLSDKSIAFDDDLILAGIHIGKRIRAVISGGDLIAAAALRSSGSSSLSGLSGLSELASTLTLLSTAPAISALASLAGLARLTCGLCPLWSSGCLTGQGSI
jgi:hypothetical protein